MLPLKTMLAGSAAGLVLLASSAALAATATAAINVRSGPGTGYAVLDTLYAGENVDVRNCEGSWCYVSHPGPDGWVSANYLSGVEASSPTYYNDGYYDDDYYDNTYPAPPIFVTPGYPGSPWHRHHQWHGKPPNGGKPWTPPNGNHPNPPPTGNHPFPPTGNHPFPPGNGNHPKPPQGTGNPPPHFTGTPHNFPSGGMPHFNAGGGAPHLNRGVGGNPCATNPMLCMPQGGGGGGGTPQHRNH